MTETLLSGLIGGFIAAFITGFISWRIHINQNKSNYYDGLMKLLSNHNWRLSQNQDKPGLILTDVPVDVATICYQHLNILFYAWVNLKIIKKDKSIEGWKNWTKILQSNLHSDIYLTHRNCFVEIFKKSDLYPSDFIKWLRDEHSLSLENLQ